MQYRSFFLIFFGCIFCFPNQALSNEEPLVNITLIEEKRLSPTQKYNGVIKAPNTSDISSQASGQLVDIVSLGSIVEKGQILSKIDDTLLQLDKSAKKAKVTGLLSKWKNLGTELERNKQLLAKGLSTQSQVDALTIEFDVAKLELQKAKADLSISNQLLFYTQPKAPFRGIITKQFSGLGEYIDTSTSILRLVELGRSQLSVFVPLTSLPFLNEGDKLLVESAFGTTELPIKKRISVASKNSDLFELLLDASSLDWPIGLTVTVHVPYERIDNALVVPSDALVIRQSGISVMRIGDDNKVNSLPVQIGVEMLESVQVTGDLQPGDKVIIRGAETIKDGQKVKVIPDNSGLVSGSL